jgi:hypothetical protein
MKDMKLFKQAVFHISGYNLETDKDINDFRWGKCKGKYIADMIQRRYNILLEQKNKEERQKKDFEDKINMFLEELYQPMLLTELLETEVIGSWYHIEIFRLIGEVVARQDVIIYKQNGQTWIKKVNWIGGVINNSEGFMEVVKKLRKMLNFKQKCNPESWAPLGSVIDDLATEFDCQQDEIEWVIYYAVAMGYCEIVMDKEEPHKYMHLYIKNKKNEKASQI